MQRGDEAVGEMRHQVLEPLGLRPLAGVGHAEDRHRQVGAGHRGDGDEAGRGPGASQRPVEHRVEGAETGPDGRPGQQTGQRGEPAQPVLPGLGVSGEPDVHEVQQPLQALLRGVAGRSATHGHVQVGHDVERGGPGGPRDGAGQDPAPPAGAAARRRRTPDRVATSTRALPKHHLFLPWAWSATSRAWGAAALMRVVSQDSCAVVCSEQPSTVSTSSLSRAPLPACPTTVQAMSR